MRILYASILAGIVAAATPAAAASVELWRLDCGSVKVNGLDQFNDAYAYGNEVRTLTDSCYLIRHDDTYMLWDTGLPEALLGTPAPDGPLVPNLTTTVKAQLGELGLTPDRISLIGISHYHFDHTGQATDFARATLMIGAADLAALKSTPVPFGAEPAALTPWLNGERKVDAVSGDRDVFGDGSVVMLSAPGHTPGSHALLVRLAQYGPVLLTGDVAHFEEQFAKHGVPPFNTDRAQSLASMERLQAIAASLKATMVVQHDASDIGKLPRFPASAK